MVLLKTTMVMITTAIGPSSRTSFCIRYSAGCSSRSIAPLPPPSPPSAHPGARFSPLRSSVSCRLSLPSSSDPGGRHPRVRSSSRKAQRSGPLYVSHSSTFFRCVFSTAFPHSKSQLRNDRLANSYVCGFSHGYIITMDGRTNRPVLTDPFTGKDLWLFPLPPPHHWPKGPPRKIEIAILTAAPYSKNCRIVLHCPKMFETFWICKARSSEWSFRRLSYDICRPSQLIHHRHNVYGVTSAGTIIIMDLLSDLPIIEFLPEGCPRISIFDIDFNIGPFITEFNGQVLFILCALLNPANPSETFRVQVYQLSERRLVRMESIGNCALFIDSEGLVMACANPGRWGAKKNHIYLTGSGCVSWNEGSVGGLVDLPGFVPMDMWKRWPRPLWVLPPSCWRFIIELNKL